jgi:hypothetical protein
MIEAMAWSDQDLNEAVQLLAAGPERQLAWVREDGTYPSLDELALAFEYEFDRVRPKSHGGQLRARDSALLALSGQLDGMSGEAHAALWKAPALVGPEWANVRELAARALSEPDA